MERSLHITGLPDEGKGAEHTTGFALWIALLVLPLCCCSVHCMWTRLLRRRDEADVAAEERDQVDSDLSRIEANLQLFSEREKSLRKATLLRSLRKQTVVLTSQDIPQDLQDDDDDDKSETDSNEVTPEEASNDSIQPAASSCSMEGELVSPLQLSTSCSICLCRYKTGDAVTRSSDEACRHVFHRDCIVSWLSTRPSPLRCPCCRQVFCHEIASFGSQTTALTAVSDHFFEEEDATQPSTGEGSPDGDSDDQ